jgi:hypothetical protein
MFFNGKLNLFSSWMPANRVKARISESYYTPTTQSACLLKCAGLKWDSITSIASELDVDFANSKKKEEPKEFQLEGEYLNKSVTMRFAVADSSVWLVDYKGTSSCECD